MMDRTHDEFTCRDCGQPIRSFPAREPPPTVCLTCQFLTRYVADLDEREALRSRLMMEV
jgi:hypothetical protein